MGIEIERRWLIPNDGRDLIGIGDHFSTLAQGYLSSSGSIVRVRQNRSKHTAWITIKGPRSNGTNSEFEYVIPFTDSEQLMLATQGEIIVKERIVVDDSQGGFEIDIFLGRLQGLIIVERELNSIDEEIQLPPWMDGAVEITNDGGFSNLSLAQGNSGEILVRATKLLKA